jgi:1-deoxy-D-xylulose-5-phosphate synthase
MTEAPFDFSQIINVRSLSKEERVRLAEALRRRIIEVVSRNGGHLASNLGMIELSIALLAVFPSPQDRIVFDVGHQCYAWKLLTGRGDQFASLRRKGGLSGFPKRVESEYDAFETGHSSTSISAALGFSRAAALRGEKRRAIAVIGDGALSGGMSFEALNDAGQRGDDLLVIVNDNQMSISRNVGGLAAHLENIRISGRYRRLKSRWEPRLERLGAPGRFLTKWLRRLKRAGREFIHKDTVLFEKLGFRYYGPVDGHDTETLIERLTLLSEIPGPVVLHVLTRKGKGYLFAESEPADYHGVAPFVIENGLCQVSGEDRHRRSFSDVFGEEVVALAKEDKRVIAISAAMTLGTGLSVFSERFPERFFDVGIAEQHAVTLAAGLAAGGMRPIVALYSTFLQRAVDQVLHDVCLQNLPVTFVIDRAGAVGADGPTHQGYYDLIFALSAPNLTVLTPHAADDIRPMLDYALRHSAPVLIRYPRATAPRRAAAPLLTNVRLIEGTDVLLLAIGTMADQAVEASALLHKKGISCAVELVLCLKPFDFGSIIGKWSQFSLVAVVEDGAERGGGAAAIAAKACIHGYYGPVVIRGHRDLLQPQASRNELLQASGLDGEGIAVWIMQNLKVGGDDAHCGFSER